MKKICLILMFLTFASFGFSAEYVLVDKDESNPNQKIYGTQLEQSTAWIGIEVTSTTTHYNQGITTTTYSQWWNVRKSTSTIYRDGFTYKKYNYPA